MFPFATLLSDGGTAQVQDIILKPGGIGQAFDRVFSVRSWTAPIAKGSQNISLSEVRMRPPTLPCSFSRELPGKRLPLSKAYEDEDVHLG